MLSITPKYQDFNFELLLNETYDNVHNTPQDSSNYIAKYDNADTVILLKQAC